MLLSYSLQMIGYFSRPHPLSHLPLATVLVTETPGLQMEGQVEL